MLQKENQKGLKAICAGLGLKRTTGSKPELLARIEETLSEEDRLYMPENPTARIIEVFGGLPDLRRGISFLEDKYKSAELKGLCKQLFLPVSGTKAELAQRQSDACQAQRILG